jgi:uncharacterized protein (TIGR02118 family)
MIKVSVLYPNGNDSKFDMAYFCDTHLSLVREKLGSACKQIDVEQGLSGAEPGSPATYAVMGHLYFDSVEDFQDSFGPHADTLMGDIPNYTNVQPVIQISEVKDL